MSDAAELRHAVQSAEVELDWLDRAVRNGQSGLTAARDEAASALATARGDLAARLAEQPRLWQDPGPVPAVLLPMRLEARYLFSSDGDELALRAIPDDVAVHTFEAGLTSAEHAAGTRYWTAVDAADADDGRRTAAWATILAELGPARAAWAVDLLRPTEQAPDGSPVFPEVTRRDGTWTTAATSLVLPDRLTFRGWRDGQVVFEVTGEPIPADLALGPDPNDLASPPDPDGDAPPLPWRGKSAWMVDFGEAVRVGMGVRVPLVGPDLSFDEVFVVGVSTRDRHEDSRRLAQTVRGHLYTRGLAFPPPDAPTNNTPGTRSDWSSQPTMRPPEVVAAGVASARPGSGQPAVALSAALGFSTAMPGTPGRADLLAALGATDRDDEPLALRAHELAAPRLGSSPTFGSDPLTSFGWITDRPSRKHFVDLVRSTGPLPTIRIGRQPYGVLPVTSLTLWSPLPPPPDDGGEPIDPDGPDPVDPPPPDLLRTFPDVPSGVVDLLRRVRASMTRQLPAAPRIGRGPDQDEVLYDLLRRQPSSVAVYFGGAGLRTAGPMVQPIAGEVPVWDVSGLRLCPLAPEGQPSLLDPQGAGTIATISGFIAEAERLAASWDGSGDPPELAGYREFFDSLGVTLDGVDLMSVGVFWATAFPTLIWATLAGPGAAFAVRKAEIEGSPDLARFREMLQSFKARLAELASWLPEVQADQGAVDRALARAAEALTSRVDAWATSVATARLRTARNVEAVGLHLGAYGWLVDLRPTAPTLRASNAGWVLTPSMQHATTAAVLHSGWAGHTDPEAFATDLSSARVRQALDTLAGLRNGRTLEELLGYQLERALHDAELDHLIPAFRTAHPLATLAPRGPGEPVDPDADELARAKLSEHLVADGDAVRRAGADLAPAVLAAAAPEQIPTVQAIVAALDVTVDAVGDALLAESVHQLVGGSPLRAGLAADTVGKANAIPDHLDVVTTPRRSTAVNHCLALAVNADAPSDWPSSPRAELEPTAEAVAAWALGPPGDWTVTVGEAPPRSLTELGVAAIDVVVEVEDPLTGSAFAARARRQLGGEGDVHLRRTDGLGGDLAITAICQAVRRLLATARATRGSDDVLEPLTAAAIPGDLPALAQRATTWWSAVHDTLQAWPDGTAHEQIAAMVELSRLGLVGARADADPATGAALRARWGATTVTSPPPPSATATEVSAWLTDVRELLRSALGGWVLATPLWSGDSWDALGGSVPADVTVGPDDVDDWLQDHRDVRVGATHVLDALQIAATCGGGQERWIVRQSRPAPARLGPVSGWVARDHPGPRAALHLAALEIGAAAAGPSRRAVLVVDQWVETLPAAVRPEDPTGVPDESASMAFRFDRPDARAPHALLVALPPDVGRGWRLEDVQATVEETLWWSQARTLDGDDLPELRTVLP